MVIMLKNEGGDFASKMCAFNVYPTALDFGFIAFSHRRCEFSVQQVVAQWPKPPPTPPVQAWSFCCFVSATIPSTVAGGGGLFVVSSAIQSRCSGKDGPFDGFESLVWVLEHFA